MLCHCLLIILYFIYYYLCIIFYILLYYICGVVYNAIRWSFYKLNRDLFYFLVFFFHYCNNTLMAYKTYLKKAVWIKTIYIDIVGFPTSHFPVLTLFSSSFYYCNVQLQHNEHFSIIVYCNICNISMYPN